MTQNPAQACRVAAMNLLARREHSGYELKQKLISRGYTEDAIDSVLTALREERLLCDERFAESFVQSRVNRGIGPVRLKQELREHGIEDDVIDDFLNHHPWRQLAVAVRTKRFGQTLPQTYQGRAKQMRFLQYRGFSSEQIRSVLDHEDWE